MIEEQSFLLPAAVQMVLSPTSLIPAAALTRFRNTALSVSRLKRWESCKQAFRFQYVDKCPPGDQGLALGFGKLLHATLERLYQWVIFEEYSGRLPEALLLEHYRVEWQASGLVGVELYQEGLTILRTYLREHPEVDCTTILAVEQEFEIQLEEFLLRGAIDRVDRLDHETIEIIDYKSNRLLFSKEEVATDLQVSAYALAARELWPWAKVVKFTFHMLRHGAVLETSRTAEQLEDARSYVLAAGRQTEAETEFPATLNPNCPYCDHRQRCEAYQGALLNDQVAVVRVGPGASLDDVARARERMAAIAKIADGKKRELETIIRAALEEHGTVTAGGTTYRLDSWNASTTYPAADVLQVLEGLKDDEGFPAFDAHELRSAVLSVDSKALERFLDNAISKVPRAPLMMARLEIETLKVTTPGAPRLHATTAKGVAKVARTEPVVKALVEAAAVAAAFPELGADAGDARLAQWSAATTLAPGEVAVVAPVVVVVSESSAPAATPATTAPATTAKPAAGAGSPGWTGRPKRTRAPTKCPCGSEIDQRATAPRRRKHGRETVVLA